MTQPPHASRSSRPAPGTPRSERPAPGLPRTRIGALAVLSASHLVNDTLQSLLLALYPLLKDTFALSYVQIGLITLAYQVTASIPQPWLGHLHDKRPAPGLLCLAFSLESIGLLTLATAGDYAFVLLAATLIGLASSVFHPLASPIVRNLCAHRPGLAQSVFQIGGNAGAALGPLLAALLVLPHGLGGLSWLCVPTVLALASCLRLARLPDIQRSLAGAVSGRFQQGGPPASATLPARTLIVLLVLMFSKYVYLAGIGTYYTFYLIHRFGLAAPSSQLYLFVFLFAVAAGTLIGGSVVDRIGGKPVIWTSILGVAPFTLAIPYVSLGWTCVLSFVTGLILASAFPAILVFAQDSLPQRTGLISGLFFGVAFGFGGLGAILLGAVAEHFGIDAAFEACSYLPLLGIAALFLPPLPPANR